MLIFKRPAEAVYQLSQYIFGFHDTITSHTYYGRDPNGQWWRSEQVPQLLEAIAGRPPMVDVAGAPMPSMVCIPMDERQVALFLKNYWPKLESLAVGEEWVR